MSQRTRIEWATHVWNPVTGCTKVSQGCKHCYAERMVERFGAWIHGYGGDVCDAPFSKVLMHPDRLDEPLHWRKPRRVFVCLMSDLFHEEVPDSFIDEVLKAAAWAYHSTFMVLTKRPQRMAEYMAAWSPPDLHQKPLRNLWLGVSVEDQRTADERIPLLLQTPAAVRFASYEPALGPVDFRRYLRHDYICCEWCGNEQADFGRNVVCEECGTRMPEQQPGVNWLICGGESGPGARPMHPDWARSARDQCQAAGVPFFFKQFGEWRPGIPGADSYGKGKRHDWPDGTCSWRVGKKRAGRLLGGREWNEVPEVKP